MQSEKLIWAAIFLLILFAVIYFQEQEGKNRVKKYLERKGFEDVDVQTKLFAGGRGTLSFDVEYVNKSGDIRRNTCVVHTGLFSDSKIYWEKPLD
jgi:hypothetical protein